MRLRVKYDHWYPKLIGMGAITLYPVIIVAYPAGSTERSLLVHEYTHVKQIRDVGWVKFYVTYLWYYLVNLVRLRSHTAAYFAIPYEVEAYANQDRELNPEERAELGLEVYPSHGAV